ncbi:MAG: hypothetical protein FJ290_14360 [Planctomycetes bacterium]|nr:hypothetical protein [Planctomycetota bacterium]
MKRTHLLWLAACAALLLAPPLWAAEANWEAELRKKLDKEIKAEYSRTPLAEVLQHLADETGCKIARDGSLDDRAPITFRTEGMRASKLLGWVCFLTDSRWVIADEMVLMCSEKEAARLVGRQRRVHDLSKLAPEARDAEAVAQFAERLLNCAGVYTADLEPGPRLAVRASEAWLASFDKVFDALPRVPRGGKLAWELPKPDVPPPIEAVTDPAKWPAAIKKAMEKKVTFDFVETPLQDVANFFSSLVEAPFTLDAEAVRRASNVTLRVNEMRFSSALDWVLKLVDLGFAVTPEAILVSTPDRITRVKDRVTPLAIVVHDVSDILDEGWQLGEMVRSLHELSEHPRSWVLGLGTRLVTIVRAGPEAEAGGLVRTMRGQKLTPARPDRAKPPAGQPEWVAEIRRAFEKRVTFDFVETPLHDVVNFLSSLVDVTIVLDEPSARDAPNITLRVNDMRLEAALGWILRIVSLRYQLKDEALFIAKPERIGEDVVTRALPAWGAVAKPEEARVLAAVLDQLLKAVPGASRWTRCRPRPGYLLDIVAREADAAAAEAIVGWLAHSKPGECHDLSDSLDAPPRKWEVNIREAMTKRVTFDFVETPLQDVVSFLSSLTDITLLLDAETLRGKAPVVTRRANEERLGEALDAILKPLGLRQVMSDEAVLVTTPKLALEARSTAWRLYDLRHLAREPAAAADLAQAIKRACEKHPEWAPSHQLADFQNRLIIRTTPAVHEAVQKMVEESAKAAPLP